MRVTTKEILANLELYRNKDITFSGWIRNNRDQKTHGFLMLNDGTAFETVQVVYESTNPNYNIIAKLNVGAAVSVVGTVILTPNQKQPFEILLKDFILDGDSSPLYPLQPKQHSREFLRKNAHLRPRTNLFNAVFRVRSVASFLIHEYFQKNNFIYLHSPIITASDGEGAGEMFNISKYTLDEVKSNKELTYEEDFFGKKAGLTVTGQLEAEAFALAFDRVYTFGPTFRAENSNTKRHAAEFWMIEPEIAFADLNDNMNLIEDMVKFLIKGVMDRCSSELQFLNSFVDKDLLANLESYISAPFARISYTDAIKLIKESKEKFEFSIDFGSDLYSEHEKFLAEKHFKRPVFIYDWPKDIKAFYMRQNDDGKTVAAVDLIVPNSGELCGGSQREERLDLLTKRMQELNMSSKELEWYLDTRRYGCCKHSGFGMGFERFVMLVTGIDNIRDVLPFPRTHKNIEF